MTDSTETFDNAGTFVAGSKLSHELNSCLDIGAELPEILSGKILHVIGEFFQRSMRPGSAGGTFGKDIGDYRIVYESKSESLDLLLVNRRTDAVYFRRLSRTSSRQS